MNSKKVIVSVTAMMFVTGLILGLAAIDKDVLIESKEVVIAAIVGIFGLGGWQVAKQSEIDKNVANGGPFKS